VTLPNGVIYTDNLPLEVEIQVTVAAKGVVTLTKIEILNPPSKINYVEGETLDLTGLEVKLLYSDNSYDTTMALADFARMDITTDPVNGATLAIADKAVTVYVNGKSASFKITVTAMQAVEVPTFSPTGGTHTGTQTVTISSATPEADIYYTLDGTTPTASSTKYDGEITVPSTTTIKAIAVKAGMKDSAVVSVTYTIQNEPADTIPSFTLQPQDQATFDGQTVTFQAEANGKPSPTYQWQVNKGDKWEDITGATDTNYTTPATTTAMNGWQYRCVATNNLGEDTSDPATLIVTTTPQVDAPTFSLKSGSYPVGAVDIIISCTTENATIYYTTDGSTPTAECQEYRGPINLDRDMTIRAIAVKTGLQDSEVVTVEYTVLETPKYTLTIEHGTDLLNLGPYEAGTIVNIKADEAPNGKVFDKWTGYENRAFGNITAAQTTFIMPAEDITITATYKNESSSGPSTPPVKPPVDPEPAPEPVIPDENGNAEIKVNEEQAEELINNAVDSGSATIELIDTNNTEGELTSVTVSTTDLQTISDKLEDNEQVNSVSITTSTGTIVVEQEVLADILESTDAETVSFAVNDAKDKLTEEQKQAVGNNPVFEINIHADDQKVTSFNGKTITISLPYELKDGEDPNNIVIYHLKDDGTIEKMKCVYHDGQVSFETNHLSMFFIAYEAAEPVTPDQPDDNKNDNIIYYILAAVIVIILIIVLAYYFLQKKQ
ncbi:chitobiase/beta-hexosaminidase C-terminal domain-containing protein, partial [Candidatus Methanomassiliicoccus intestinalis]|uniref:chitobiase/beta-hexosaminidase C-terminal domain-containing protein n=1 Tax=Candidatus Methanomassiliicoccus intestinalis TaxID=1406512 RepID=UPI0037DDB139